MTKDFTSGIVSIDFEGSLFYDEIKPLVEAAGLQGFKWIQFKSGEEGWYIFAFVGGDIYIHRGLMKIYLTRDLKDGTSVDLRGTPESVIKLANKMRVSELS